MLLFLNTYKKTGVFELHTNLKCYQVVVKHSYTLENSTTLDLF